MSIEFIAEISSNHNQNLSRCFKFMDTAKMVNCSGVKFQLFRIDELFIPEVIAQREEIKKRKHWELPLSFLPELSAHCKKIGLKFSCTPFYLEAVEELLPYVDFYKIASYELLWDDLLKNCASTGKPVVLSTGMANLKEVQKAVRVLRKWGCKDLTLLHCISNYPVQPGDCNLAVIETLREEFSCPVGWSDHSVKPGVIMRAVHRWGAAMVEFHLDLEGEGYEYKGGHCWLPEQIKSTITAVCEGFSADGDRIKKPGKVETKERKWRADPSDGLRPLRSIRKGRWR